MNSFTADWLDVREPADHAARAMPGPLALARAFAARVREHTQGPVRLVDLAGGTGNNVRFLAPVIRGTQHWTVWDTDTSLLARLQGSCRAWADKLGGESNRVGDSLVVKGPDFSLNISGTRHDLRRSLDFSGFDGVSCAALLDLVSASWCEKFIDAAQRAGRPPLFFSLVADGAWSWSPSHPDDGAIAEMFGRDMKTNKGFGPALGPDAAAVAAAKLRAAGLSVDEVASPWHLESNAIDLQTHLLNFHATVFEIVGGVEARRWQEWLTARRAMIGRQELQVGHREILASR